MRPDSPAAAGGSSLTAEPDRFSDAAWDLLLASQEQARRWRHGEMDVEHLMQALFGERRYASWIEPLPLDADRLLDQLDDFCAVQPAASGRELYIGEALEALLDAAECCRADSGAPLIDIPQLLQALLEEPRLGRSLLAEQGLSQDLLQRQQRPEPEPPLPPPPAPAPVAPTPPPQAAPTASPVPPAPELRLE